MTVTKKLSVVSAGHPLMRFVSREAIALGLGRPAPEIYRVDCWRYVIHVVGKGMSTFVSYADMPPILGVSSPNPTDVRLWRKRWRPQQYLAPQFWLQFYAHKFRQVTDLGELADWDELVAYIQFGLTESDRQFLESICLEITYQLSSQVA